MLHGALIALSLLLLLGLGVAALFLAGKDPESSSVDDRKDDESEPDS